MLEYGVHAEHRHVAAAEMLGQPLRLRCGLWRERGTVRTSTSVVIPCPVSMSMNLAIGRVEWPMVKTTRCESLVASVSAACAGAAGARRAPDADAPLRGAGRSAGEKPPNPAAQHGQEFLLEPGMGLKPGGIARRGMG